MPQYIITYTAGTAPGPYNVYLSGSSGLNLYASNVSRTQLQNGFIITFPDGIPSSSVVVDNISYGCATEEILVFPTPTPTKTPSVTITPSITPSNTITPTITPSPTITPTLTPTVTPSFTATPSITPSITPSNTINPTITPTRTITPSLTVTRTPTATPAVVSYLWFGTTSKYPCGTGSQTCACFSKNCGRPYYTSKPYGTFGVGDFVYENSSLTTPFNGSSLWIAMNQNCTNPVWITVQVASNGQVLSLITC